MKQEPLVLTEEEANEMGVTISEEVLDEEEFDNELNSESEK